MAASCSAHALSFTLQAGSIAHPDLPVDIRNVRLHCSTQAAQDKISCSNGHLETTWEQQKLAADFKAELHADGQWSAQGSTGLDALSWSDASGRYATDKLQARIRFKITQQENGLLASVQAQAPSGQAYVEPVFVDFELAPAQLRADLQYQPSSGQLTVTHFDFEQTGVLQASGKLQGRSISSVDASIQIQEMRLGAAFDTFAQPFMIGTQLEHLKLSGQASASFEIQQGLPTAVDIKLLPTRISSKPADAEVEGLRGKLHWRANTPADASSMQWDASRIAKLKMAGADAQFQVWSRNLKLLAPLRIPVAGGAISVRRFSAGNIAQDGMSASLDAQIEPIDLAQLCRALGWPEFSGSLSGSLPGLSLQDRELKLDGVLTANAFDGHASVDRLRVLDPFGRVPRISSNIHLRDLDLAALTGAFSFGRIEGRLDADIEDLRLLKWRPVAFRARIMTPPEDRSRHRISQRAIDNISSIGGGPTGILSRGFLRFFDDFAYDRIGWSCVLNNGVCRMGGIEPTADGGYVLVKGKLLPRIDVVGYSRNVDWNTFVSQLSSIREGGPPELR